MDQPCRGYEALHYEESCYAFLGAWVVEVRTTDTLARKQPSTAHVVNTTASVAELVNVE